jgi:hypothetical protein
VVVIKAGVVNEPVVPVPPPPDEVQDVVLVEDQVTTEVAPLAIEGGDAERVTDGALGLTGGGTVLLTGTVVVTPVLLQAVRPKAVHRMIKRTPVWFLRLSVE